MIKSVYDNRVLIERFVPGSKTESGYILPAESEEVLVGKVLYIGEDVKKTAVGDTVVFDKYDYKEVNIDGDDFVIAKEDTLICKMQDNEGH